MRYCWSYVVVVVVIVVVAAVVIVVVVDAWVVLDPVVVVVTVVVEGHIERYWEETTLSLIGEYCSYPRINMSARKRYRDSILSDK